MVSKRRMIRENTQKLKSIVDFFFLNPEVQEMTIHFEKPYYAFNVDDIVTICHDFDENPVFDLYEALFTFYDYVEGDHWVVAKVFIQYRRRGEQMRLRILEVRMWREKVPVEKVPDF